MRTLLILGVALVVLLSAASSAPNAIKGRLVKRQLPGGLPPLPGGVPPLPAGTPQLPDPSQLTKIVDLVKTLVAAVTAAVVALLNGLLTLLGLGDHLIVLPVTDLPDPTKQEAVNLALELINLNVSVNGLLATLEAIVGVDVYATLNPNDINHLLKIVVQISASLEVTKCNIPAGLPVNLCDEINKVSTIVDCTLIQLTINLVQQPFLQLDASCNTPIGNIAQSVSLPPSGSGLPSGVPGLPSGVPGLPSGVPGLPSGVPGLPVKK